MPFRNSRRHGFELTAYGWLPPHWPLDADYGDSRARFIEGDPSHSDAGGPIAGSVLGVFSADLSLDYPMGWYG